MAQQKSPRRTQAERTQQRKERLIREATRYFGQYVYRGAKLAEIARAAGVTEPGLPHHFPSKEHLLTEVLAERDRLDRERFDPRLAWRHRRPPPFVQGVGELQRKRAWVGAAFHDISC